MAGAGPLAETPPLGSLTGYYPNSRISAAAYEPIASTDFGQHPSADHEQRPATSLDRLANSFALRTALRKVAANKRIAICGTRVFRDPEIVTQELGNGERVARWSGVVLCNRAGCPVCAEARARKFGQRVRRLLSAGGLWQHVTLTLAHGPGDSWAQTYSRLLSGLQELTKGQAACVSGLIDASVRATESTWSVRSGWHVHFHVLWRLPRQLLLAEKELLRARWALATGASAVHGMRFGAAFDCSDSYQQTQAARYVSKLAQEMSGAHKGAHPEHFTLGEVFQRAARGDRRFVALVREYQQATHGRRLYQLDRRAKRMHDAAPELPETIVLHEWRTTVDRLEFSGLSRAERYGGEPAAVYLPLEVAARTRGDPSADVADTIDALLRSFDAQSRQPQP